MVRGLLGVGELRGRGRPGKVRCKERSRSGGERCELESIGKSKRRR